MTVLSDYLENRLVDSILGRTTFQIPTLIRVTTLDVTSTYNVSVNKTDVLYAAQAGDTEADVLTNLKTLLDATAEPVTTLRYQDSDGAEVLQVKQDNTYASIALEVSATATGVLGISNPVFIALYTSNPDEDNSGDEVAGLGYFRVSATFDASLGGVGTLSQAVVFGPAGVGGWGDVTHAAILDSYQGGNLLCYAGLPASKTILETDTLTFPLGDISLSIQ